ncbi:MAG: sigma-70 family RNA polymerase sigma factor [Phycisphaerae bacterium]
MQDATLADLIRRAQNRESTAFDALVDRYGGRVFGFVFRITASRDAAEDLTQEVFLRVVRMIGRYQDDGRFEAWLFRIAANLVRDRGRRSRRTGHAVELGGSERGDGLDARPGPSVSPAAGLETREDLDRMSRALAALPEAEREVILMRHFSDLSFKEIADAMGTPLGTALARAHRGLAKLRELMTQMEEPAGTPGEPVPAGQRP